MQRALFDGSEVQPLHDATTLATLRQSIKSCQQCALHKSRTAAVFGEGRSLEPEIAFVGEAPGPRDDKQGAPFVGPAGEVLTQAIEAMGFSRQSVYLCNVVCCRPPGGRRPEKVETHACKPKLHGQLLAVKPQIIVALGESAAQTLLSTPQRLETLRGEWHVWKDIPLRVTYHPAFALRAPRARGKMWRDLQAVMRRLGRETDSEYEE
jgi:DNA polymerase